MHATIRPVLFLLTLGFAFAALPAHAAGTVQVSYLQPDKFTDVGNWRHDIDDTLKQLTSHFEALAERHLADGQALRIEVLDIDLAGEMRPSRRAAQDIRVLKGQADWPRISLRYALESAGHAPRKGEHSVADMAYLQRLVGAAANEPLAYEKRMLAAWFSAEFGAAGAE